MSFVDEQKQDGKVQSLRFADQKGTLHAYEWLGEVPLNGNKKTIQVNFLSYQRIKKDQNGQEKVTYKNSWVTDTELSSENVGEVTLAGRCRWKIENECFNTLKNQGYSLDHSFGHGSKNLSFIFYLLI